MIHFTWYPALSQSIAFLWLIIVQETSSSIFGYCTGTPLPCSSYFFWPSGGSFCLHKGCSAECPDDDWRCSKPCEGVPYPCEDPYMATEYICKGHDGCQWVATDGGGGNYPSYPNPGPPESEYYCVTDCVGTPSPCFMLSAFGADICNRAGCIYDYYWLSCDGIPSNTCDDFFNDPDCFFMGCETVVHCDEVNGGNDNTIEDSRENEYVNGGNDNIIEDSHENDYVNGGYNNIIEDPDKSDSTEKATVVGLFFVLASTVWSVM
eukprot:scaffold2256_cov166-Amphora_coffeaeformis.AAC.12